MLKIIKDALQEIVDRQDVGINVGINADTIEDMILVLLKQDSKLTAKTLASTLNVSQRQVERIIKLLKESGRLIRHGSNKAGYWEVR